MFGIGKGGGGAGEKVSERLERNVVTAGVTEPPHNVNYRVVDEENHKMSGTDGGGNWRSIDLLVYLPTRRGEFLGA